MRELTREFAHLIPMGHHLHMFALFLFIALFAGVLLFTFVLRKRSDFNELAAMPLNDDETSEVKP